ncbi:hypothetical protein WMY93_031802 [Mugilogobius chulae]|uniref:Uncharacterized protein n=1 Tax=Mugilogobius chulae TaxID=88201 RepID=A0AAW0MCU4_9GOBI
MDTRDCLRGPLHLERRGFPLLVRFCETRVQKIYCNYYDLSGLVCAEDAMIQTYVKIFELMYMTTVLLVLLVFIVFTYVRILVVCFRGSKQKRQKALSTCAPHLASLTNYGLSIF